MEKTDVAAFVWPAYSNNSATKRFWSGTCGEWESVISASAKFKGHRQPRIPLWGYVDEANPEIMAMEIQAALNYGVNVFIYDWYFYNNDFFLSECLENGFLKADNVSKMQFYIMYANHDANWGWNKKLAGTEAGNMLLWSAKINNVQWERITDYIVNEYFLLKNYYKINNKPVFMLYDLNRFTDSFGNGISSRKAFDILENKAVKKGLKGVHFQASLRSFEKNHDGLSVKNTENEAFNAMKFDSATYYQYVHIDGFEDNSSYTVYSDKCWDYMGNAEKHFNTMFIPHVSIGWDNNPRYEEAIYMPILAESTKAEFKNALLTAKRYLEEHPKNPRLITINSWNEWTEGSYLMPDSVNGYAYLEAIKEVFKI